MEDNHFSELKDAELLQNRINILRDMDEYVGRYYSIAWVRKNVLMQTDEDIKQLDKEMSKEGTDDEYNDQNSQDDENV